MHRKGRRNKLGERERESERESEGTDRTERRWKGERIIRRQIERRRKRKKESGSTGLACPLSPST